MTICSVLFVSVTTSTLGLLRIKKQQTIVNIDTILGFLNSICESSKLCVKVTDNDRTPTIKSVNLKLRKVLEFPLQTRCILLCSRLEGPARIDNNVVWIRIWWNSKSLKRTRICARIEIEMWINCCIIDCEALRKWWVGECIAKDNSIYVWPVWLIYFQRILVTWE
jgi:hypothetical protein